MKYLICIVALTSSFFSLAQSSYENVVIEAGESGQVSPCEPSIAVSQVDPKYMVAGAVLDRVYASADSGKTWSSETLTSRYGVYGDPCIVASPKGDFFYLHLSDPSGEGWSDPSLLDRIVIQQSKDEGRSWTKGEGIGFNGSKDQDKEWATTSTDGKCTYVTWTQFDKYDSRVPTDSSNILFSKGNQNGKQWTEPIRINEQAGDCVDGDWTVEGAVPAAGPDKTVYVAWAHGNTIWFDRSKDDGETWLDKDIKAAEIVGGWDHAIPGIGRANGMPVTLCDQSGGPHNGRIYINWADQRNGEDDTDIWVCYSDDEGETWSDAIRVNDDDSGRHQFFTWMTVDPVTGYLFCVFYDRRNHVDSNTDVYVAVSEDGGLNWVNLRVSESPFLPPTSGFFGDYNNISAYNGVVRPIWTRQDLNGRKSVLTALINWD